MIVCVEQQLGEAMLRSSTEATGTEVKDLSCECGGLSAEYAKTLVLGAVSEWNQSSLIIWRRLGSGRREAVRTFFVDMDQLSVVFDAALQTEEVVTIRDPSVLGGLAFDLSPDEGSEDQSTFELLVTAWGVHEATVERLADKLGERTFRQGTPLGEDRR